MLEYWTFGQYPLATIAHWLQGVVCGVFIGHSLYHNKVHGALVSLPFIALFLAYEITEMVDIKDHAYIDIFNFGIMVWLGTIVSVIVLYLRSKYKDGTS